MYGFVFALDDAKGDVRRDDKAVFGDSFEEIAPGRGLDELHVGESSAQTMEILVRVCQYSSVHLYVSMYM